MDRLLGYVNLMYAEIGYRRGATEEYSHRILLSQLDGVPEEDIALFTKEGARLSEEHILNEIADVLK